MASASSSSGLSETQPHGASTKPAAQDAQPDPEPPAPSLQAADPGVYQPPRREAPAPLPAANRLRHPNRERLNLYIMRHASAGTSRANPKLDVKRPLDKDGKRHCFHLAHVLNGLKVNFDLIVSSPLKRCLQTAQLIGTEAGYEARILLADGLKPDANFAQFQRLVHECRAYENVMMVGHNPTLTYFLGQLIGHPAPLEGEGSGLARVRLRKGSMARVTIDRGPAMLQWLLEPRIVRVLYDTSTKSSRRKTSRK